ncbi:MAG: sodium:solute symporter [Mailhella sp.]|nr:sodium:solute symporter [Mailhella sp.]
MLVKVLILLFFFLVTLGVGLACRRSTSDVHGFVLGSRSVGSWLTAFAYGTSYFSAVIFVGYAGQFGWKYGVAATWIGIGNAFIGSLLAWNVLGRRTRIMTQQLDSATMPEFFGKRFQSPVLRIAAAAIIFVFLIPYTASLYNGLSRLFGMAFGIDYTWCVLGMAILTAGYVLLGGYMAAAVNDFIQGIIMLFGIVAVIWAVLEGNGGMSAAMTRLSAISAPQASDMQGALISFFGPAPLELLGVVLLTSFGTWGLPQMVGKFYAITDESAISKGTVISTIFAFIVAGGCYFLGGFGQLYADVVEYVAPGKPVFDSIIPAMLSGLPDILLGIVVILVLSASMSTLSSLVITSGSTLALDIFVPMMLRRGMLPGNRSQLLQIRLLVVFFIAVSSVIAIVQAKSSVTFIAQLMGISWGALAGAFLAPFLFALYWKRTSSAAVMASFIAGVAIMCACMACMVAGVPFFTPFLSSPINAGVLAMLAGMVIVPAVSLVTPAPKREEVDAMFASYDRKVVVHASTALSDAEELR